MDDNISGEIRIVQAKIKYNEKQLIKATEGNEKKLISTLKRNIELYKKELIKLERRLLNGKKE